MNKEKLPVTIIDSAVRLDPDPAEIDRWRAIMADTGLAHAVIAPADRFVAVDNEEGNAWVAGIVSRYPDTFSGLAVANPWYGSCGTDWLRKAFDRGRVGLYLHPGLQGFHLTDAVVDPLIEVCIESHKPVYAHTGIPICCEPFQLAELARRFPAATFIMGHGAYPDFWYDVTVAADQAPNILVETSCQVGGILELALTTIGPDRLLFGSGFPRSRPGVELKKLQWLNLAPEIYEKIMFRNPQRIWGITV